MPLTVWVDASNMMPPWDGSEQEPFPSINMALYVVHEGGTIYVRPGTYNENVYIFETINLIGLDKSTTFIVGSNYRNEGAVLNIMSSYWVNVTGFTIQAIPQSTGVVSITYSNNVNIHDNIIQPTLPIYQPAFGVNLYGDSLCTISRNQIDHTGTGIYLQESAGNVIKLNTIRNNLWAITLQGSSYNSIYNNNFISNTCYPVDNGQNQWNKAYPEGGNYWSDFDSPGEGAYDGYYGIFQNISGPDFIVDLGPPSGGLNPYIHIVGGGMNRDFYPFIIPDAWDAQ
jgi:parallel beta-helix repeat protein